MNPTERLRALLATVNSAKWTRDDAHALLDATFDIAGGLSDADGEMGRLAQAAALTLSRVVAGWTVPNERTPEEWDRLAVEQPSIWREEFIERMRITPAVLPQPAVEAMMFALVNLQNGKQAAILRPKNRKDVARISRRALEQAILVWIEMETARGKPAGKVQKDVADAILRTPDAIEGWLRSWRGRAGMDRVADILCAARDYALGKETLLPIPEEFLLIRLFVQGSASPLAGLASSWKAARD